MDTTKESFESDKFSAKKRIKTGILIGILLFFGSRSLCCCNADGFCNGYGMSENSTGMGF